MGCLKPASRPFPLPSHCAQFRKGNSVETLSFPTHKQEQKTMIQNVKKNKEIGTEMEVSHLG